MNRLFGPRPPQSTPPQTTKPVPPPPTPQELQQQRQKVEAKVRELSQTITLLDNDIKQFYEKSRTVKGNSQKMYRDRCVELMKKKKEHEQQLKSFASQRVALGQGSLVVQNTHNNVEMDKAIKLEQQQKREVQELDMRGIKHQTESKKEYGNDFTEKDTKEKDSINNYNNKQP